MQRELLAPFVAALGETFETMLAHPVHTAGHSCISREAVFFDISGIINLTGDAEGVVVLSLSRNVALQAASTLLMCECTEINADVTDAVGEITNVVAGSAKARFTGLCLRIGLPSVVVGKDHQVIYPSEVGPLSICLECAWGSLSLTVGLVRVPMLAEV